MDRRPARLNRTGLAIVGALLVLISLAALARIVELWPDQLGPAGTAVTDTRARELTSDNTWFWVVLAIVLAILAVLALAWLAAQFRNRSVSTLRVEPDPRHGNTTMPARAATAALEADLTDSPHFRSAQASLQGSPGRPKLRLVATLRSGTDYDAARSQLNEALNRHQQALDAEDLPTTVLLRATR